VEQLPENRTMATVWLDHSAWKDGDLPEVCMRCGRPATVRVDKTFRWFPNWVYFFLLIHIALFLIGAVMMTRQRRVEVPLCQRHRWHWDWQLLVLVAGLGAGGMVLFEARTIDTIPRPEGDPDVVVFWTAWVLAYLWVGFAVLVKTSGIHAVRFTREAIQLKGVARAFVDAYEEDRKQREHALDQADQERWWERRAEGSAEREQVREPGPFQEP
jgi:hypothetical protein